MMQTYIRHAQDSRYIDLKKTYVQYSTVNKSYGTSYVKIVHYDKKRIFIWTILNVACAPTE